jgi:hypothetical protein
LVVVYAGEQEHEVALPNKIPTDAMIAQECQYVSTWSSRNGCRLLLRTFPLGLRRDSGAR